MKQLFSLKQVNQLLRYAACKGGLVNVVLVQPERFSQAMYLDIELYTETYVDGERKVPVITDRDALIWNDTNGTWDPTPARQPGQYFHPT